MSNFILLDFAILFDVSFFVYPISIVAMQRLYLFFNFGVEILLYIWYNKHKAFIID